MSKKNMFLLVIYALIVSWLITYCTNQSFYSKNDIPTRVLAGSKKISIAVIDTGVFGIDEVPLCNKEATVDFTNTDIYDTYGHGTNITFAILNEIKDKSKVCFYILKFWSPLNTEQQNYHNFLKAVEYLTKTKVDYINISGGGPNPYLDEREMFKKIVKTSKIYNAAGNDNRDLNKDCYWYPACYDLGENLHVIGNLTAKMERQKDSNWGSGVVTDWEVGTNVCFKGICMTGTSQATAVSLGKAVQQELEK